MLLVLLLLSSSGLAQREGVVINRRARQKLPQRQQVRDPVLAPVQPAQVAFQGSYEDEYGLTPSQWTRQAENVTPYSEPDYKHTALSVYNQQSVRERQYLPRAEPEFSGTYVDSVVLSVDQTTSHPNSYASDIKSRQSSRLDINQYSEPQRVSSRRSRLPRRRTQIARRRDNAQTDYREQLAGDINNDDIREVSRIEQSSDRELRRGERAGTSSRRLRTRVDKPVQNNIGQGTTPTRTRSRSRSRHRSRSRSLEVTTKGYEYTPTQASRTSRGRLRERPNNRISEASSNRNDYKKKSSSKATSGPNVHFPKKNLFPKLPKFNPPRENEVVSGKSAYNKQTKSSGRSRGRFSQKEEIRPSRTFQRKDSRNDYQNIELQSGKEDSVESAPSVITVTHQVPTRTVFTIVETGETKSLYADTFESSLQVLSVSDLHSTEINSHRVVYAQVQTKHPQFGVKEYEYEAIQPTSTYRTEDREINVGGRRTSIVDTIYTTIYNVEKITARVTDSPARNHVEPEHVNQIGAILQNVLLKLLGGGLLGSNLPFGGPTINGPPRTQFITHTRSFLTTTTTMETVVIPVNFRGKRIDQTVTDLKTLTSTTTDYSVQTLLNYEKPSDEPFYPLAPALHRAARVVPAEPFLNTLPIYPTAPPAFSTSFVTATHTAITTISTDITSEITITLGGREIKTEITQPTTQVVTSTSLSTQSLLVQPSYQQQNHAVSQLQLIKALLRLKH